MNASLLPAMAIGAGLNTLGAITVFLLGRTHRRGAIALAVGLPVFASILFGLVEEKPSSGHSPLAEFAVVVCTVSVVWFPAAILAVVSASQTGRARLLAAAGATTLAAVMGALLLFVGLAFSCYLLGECL